MKRTTLEKKFNGTAMQMAIDYSQKQNGSTVFHTTPPHQSNNQWRMMSSPIACLDGNGYMIAFESMPINLMEMTLL